LFPLKLGEEVVPLIGRAKLVFKQVPHDSQTHGQRASQRSSQTTLQLELLVTSFGQTEVE